MTKKELFDLRMKTVRATLNREKTDYIPTLANPGPGIAAWAGKKYVDVFYKPEEFSQAMNCVFDQLWADCTLFNGAQATPGAAARFGGVVQGKFSPDGTTEEHYQMPQMRDDEYDQLIADPERFVANVLLRRKYPWIFEDPERGKKAIKEQIDELVYSGFTLFPKMNSSLEEEYGVVQLADWSFELNPGYPALDLLFDTFRGFKGTLTDLRRHPKEVKAAVDKLWETRMQMWNEMEVPFDFPIYASYPHIPTYLSPKQFEELYWPHYKKCIERLAAGGNKMLICMEGNNWIRFLDYFREVPKDSCIMMVDGDDIFEVYKKIGDWQLMAGGAKLSLLRAEDNQINIDYAKKVIDTCAVDGGFFFCTDRTWISPGDVNQNLIDIFNFAHEYGKR